MRTINGFTLMEMLVALAIIGILLSFAVPNIAPTAIRNNIIESAGLVADYKPKIEAYYKLTGKFPKDNHQASMPDADKIIGNYMTHAYQEDGAIHIVFGNKIQPAIMGKILTLRAIYVDKSPNSPVSWICGNDEIPNGMTAAGENKTNIDRKYLPLNCK